MDQLIVSAIFWSKVLQGSSRIPLPQTPTTVIFAPHPDDEILCCSNLIKEKIKAGEKVKVVIVTDGDAYTKRNHLASRAYASVRQKESIKAANKLGLRSSDLMFLGFPDGILMNLSVTSLKSPHSGRVDTSSISYSPNLPYTKPNLVALIDRILDQSDPYEIYIPSQMDTHPDHKAVGKIVKNIIKKRNEDIDTYEYIVHKKTMESIIDGTRPDRRKLSLISVFKSQFHDALHKEFLESFAYFQEKFLISK